MTSIHIIGHSMGAQIAAYTGLKVRKICQEPIGRITGLDPAGPLFEWPHLEYLDEILDPSDADFVDVIHTNGGRIGMITPAGHADFYVNGGEKQPGCDLWSCSHIRAVEYWIASIRNPHLFKAVLYKDIDRSNARFYPMGILANKLMPHGTYYLETGNEFQKYVKSVTTIKNSFV